MKHRLRVCTTGEEEIERETTLEISEKDGVLTFVFIAKNSQYYCPFQGEYNKIHAEGDVCEVFIGSHPDRTEYYEMEITPKGDLMLARMVYHGEGQDGPIMEINFVEKPFVTTNVELFENGYMVSLSFKKSAILTGEGEIYFNAYRIDTDGGKCLDDCQLGYALNPTMRPKFHTPSKFVFLKDFCK